MPEAGMPTVETIVRELNAVEKFEKVERRIKKNDTIAGYYEGHAELLMNATGARQPCELPKKDFTLWNACKRSARDMPKCCALWQMDRYPKQRVKDVKKTNSCRNRFCENCQNVLATKRDRKYTPFLEALEKNFDIYAVTVTVPNCERDKLGETISRMFYNFGYITDCLTETRKYGAWIFHIMATRAGFGHWRSPRTTKRECFTRISIVCLFFARA